MGQSKNGERTEEEVKRKMERWIYGVRGQRREHLKRSRQSG